MLLLRGSERRRKEEERLGGGRVVGYRSVGAGSFFFLFSVRRFLLSFLCVPILCYSENLSRERTTLSSHFWGVRPDDKEEKNALRLLPSFSLSVSKMRSSRGAAAVTCCSWSRASSRCVVVVAPPLLRRPRERVISSAVAPPFSNASSSFPAADASRFVIRAPKTESEFYAIAALRAEAYYAVREISLAAKER